MAEDEDRRLEMDVDAVDEDDAAAARREEAEAAAKADVVVVSDEAMLDQQPRRPIERLPPDLVNRIAAGEVVQRPASALKELLENSLDAGSTHISITLREGGFKLLQVQDDGCGIRPEDLPLLCERHATSKLRSFGGLSDLTSLGFRGEALASLSYVARVTVTTAVSGAAHALRATYRDGALLGEPQPVAGCRGTTVSVEDLFSNVYGSRRRGALGSPSDEHARCADVVGRYASHRAWVAFSLRRAGAARPDVLTTGISSSVSSSAAAAAAAPPPSSPLPGPAAPPPPSRRASRLEALRAVYGAPLAKSLLPFAFKVGRGAGGGGGGKGDGGGGGENEDENEGESGEKDPPPSFEATGYVSAPDWPGRRSAFVLFVNGRCVEAGALRRAAEGAHAAVAPRGARPFFFVDLRLPNAAVDANVHPTKREVAFLHRDAVASSLADAVDSALRRADRAGRSFVQRLLPGAPLPPRPATATATAGAKATTAATEATTRRDRAGGDRNLVRVDAKARTLDAFVAFQRGGSGGAGGEGASAAGAGDKRATAAGAAAPSAAALLASVPARRRGAAAAPPSLLASEDPLLAAPAGLLLPPTTATTADDDDGAARPPSLRAPRPNPSPSTRLASVDRILKRTVDAQAHAGIEEMLKGASYVGLVDRGRCLVQSGTSLVLLDLRPLVRDLARQQALRRVDCHTVARVVGKDRGEERLPLVSELIELALLEEKAGGEGDDENDDGDLSSPSRISEAASLASRLLVLKREPLREHFGIGITESGRLASLPEVVDGLRWRPSSLPRLALSLARDADLSSSEASFFETVSEVLSRCVSLPGWEEGEDDDEEEDDDDEEGEEAKERGETPLSLFDRPPTRALERAVAHVVLPAMRVQLRPPRARATDGSVVELTRLQNLYKIFERC